MIDVAPFVPAHLIGFEVQPSQRSSFELQPDAMSASFGDAWTALLDGKALSCGGFVELWPGRAYLWGLLSIHAGPHMLALTRIARFAIGLAPYRRVEMAADAAYPEAGRWAGLLGMQCETPEPMRSFLPGGRDAYLYARVK